MAWRLADLSSPEVLQALAALPFAVDIIFTDREEWWVIKGTEGVREFYSLPTWFYLMFQQGRVLIHINSYPCRNLRINPPQWKDSFPTFDDISMAARFGNQSLRISEEGITSMTRTTYIMEDQEEPWFPGYGIDVAVFYRKEWCQGKDDSVDSYQEFLEAIGVNFETVYWHDSEGIQRFLDSLDRKYNPLTKSKSNNQSEQAQAEAFGAARERRLSAEFGVTFENLLPLGVVPEGLLRRTTKAYLHLHHYQ